MKRFVCATLRSIAALCLLAVADVASAQQADDAVTTHVFRLKHIRGEFSQGFARIETQASTRTLAKTPDFGSDKTHRGFLKTGDAPAHHIDLIWDETAGKLHLDLNRNGDLTDDPIFEKLGESPPYFISHQFTSITIVSPLGPQHGVYIVDVSMNRFRTSEISGSARVRSGWESDIELYGRAYRLSFAGYMGDDPAKKGRVILRPAGKRYHDMYDLGGAPVRLFFDDHLYDLSFAFEPGNNGGVMIARLAEQPVELGDLEIKGEYITRLVLQAERPVEPPLRASSPRPVPLPRAKKPVATYPVILDEPRGKMKVPVGAFAFDSVYLDAGTSVGVFSSRGGGSRILAPGGGVLLQGSNQRAEITTASPAVLVVGGPLKNIVTVDWSGWGNALHLGYLFQGAGGESYDFAGNRPLETLWWLLIIYALFAGVCILIILLAMGGMPPAWWVLPLGIAIYAAVMTVGTTLGLLPFLILTFRSGFYRQRLAALLGLPAEEESPSS